MRVMQQIPKNTQGNDWVVGDIHGCFRALERLLVKMQFNPLTDRLFAVGDLADRGPDSKECIEWLSRPYFHSLFGNHEMMALVSTPKYHITHGGQWFQSLPPDEKVRYRTAFEQLPWAFEIETDHGQIGVVHAEVPDDDWESFKAALAEPLVTTFTLTSDTIEAYALWAKNLIRGVRPFTGVRNIHRVYVGHAKLQVWQQRENVIYLDTGCYDGNALTAVQIQGADSPQIIEVPAR